jgi:hypothetical protein
VAECLEILAAVEAVRGRSTLAARLFGAVEALREAIGVATTPIFRPSYEQFVAAVRVQLGEKNFVAAWAEGWAMPLEQAIADALGEARSSLA